MRRVVLELLVIMMIIAGLAQPVTRAMAQTLRADCPMGSM